MSYPSRYTKGVNKTERKKELDQRKKSKKPLKDLYPKKTDKQAIKKGVVKPSKYTKKFNELYPDLKFSISGLSKRFNIPEKDLKEIKNKGIAAWRTGSRPGANATAWYRARIYKAILAINKKIKVPKNDPDYKLYERVWAYQKKL